MANTLNSNIEKMLAGLPKQIEDINAIIALSSIAFIKENLTDNGVTGEGKSLGKYSERPLSPLLFLNSSTGKGAEDKVAAYIKRQKKANPGSLPGISYKTFRELNNLPTDHVTLSFTGETLNDLGVIANVYTGNKVITSVGSKNTKTKEVFDKKGRKTGTKGTEDILEELAFKYGDILSVTPEQEKELSFIYNDEIQIYINKYL